MGEINELLTARGVNKKFGGVQAIRNLTVAIQKGKITGLIGPNGAGKTTFFNLINGIYPLDEGEIHFAGNRISGLPSDEIAGAGISRTFQLLNNFPRLSVYENIRAGVITKFLDRRVEEEKITAMLELLRIPHLANKDISEIPPVARKLVEVGRALIADPQLVLFDEIMAGFNEEEVVNLIELIRRENQKGMTFCIIGHTMRAIMGISDWVVVLDEGSNFLEGTPKEIQENAEVQRIYLGG